ncbi:hypothetical protein GCM10022406_26970 [Hymenobacter algoricola]|uniref:Uncharacterized protein n=1 Tax=Hymenobacter algoricola TaxID=486267 RepID=A0ABP7ND54_9BACT
MGGFGAAHQLLPDFLYPGTGLAVGVNAAVLLRHFGGGLQSQGYFLLGRHIDVLHFTGYFVCRPFAVVRDEGKQGEDEGNYVT